MKKTLLALLALLCTPFALRADTLYVTPTGAGNQDGSSWANAFAGIQAAVDAADAAYAADGTLHEILVTNGVYSRVAVSRDFALQVRSVNGAASTIIDGNGTNNCIAVITGNYIYSQRPTFTGFTLQNGNVRNQTYDYGGGAAGGSLVDCVVQDCEAWQGGGTYKANTTRCIIRRCYASSYGGIVGYGLHLNDLMYGNSGYWGPIYSADLYSCTIADNTAESSYYSFIESSLARNCIRWNNTIYNYETGQYEPSAQSDPSDPKFVGGGDYRLRAGSPAFDDGLEDWQTEAYVGATDLAGNARVQGAKIDRGCYEGTALEGVLVTASAEGNGSVSPPHSFVPVGTSVTITADTSTWHRDVARWITNGVVAAGSDLPAGLRPLEYVESTGDQYVDTGIATISGTTAFDYVFENRQTGTTWKGLVGARNGTTSYGSQAYNVLVRAGEVRLDTVGQSTRVSTTGTNTLSYTAAATVFNGTSYANAGKAALGVPLMLFTFGTSADGGHYAPSAQRLFSCSISEGGVLVRDFVPVADANGVAGLFDRVTETVFYSATATPLVAGPEKSSAGNTLTFTATGEQIDVVAQFATLDWFVNGTTGSDTANNGRTASTAFKTIQHAIDVAAPDEQIFVAAGTYAPIDASRANVAIIGDGRDTTVIDGGGTNRCANLGERNFSLLQGFTLRNGRRMNVGTNPGHGEEGIGGGGVKGGILYDCTITNCVSTFGGGAFHSEIHRSIIVDCSAYDGGGTIMGECYNCLFECNWAVQGGAASMASLWGCTVVKNRAVDYAAVYVSSAYSCVFKGNKSANGRTAYALLVHGECCFEEEMDDYNVSFTDDPLFVDFENGDYRLREDSPCIDHGWGDVLHDEYDVRGPGFPRRIDALHGEEIADMGCYEGGVPTSQIPTPPTPAATRTINVSGGGAALQNAINGANDGDTLLVAAGTYSAIDASGKELNIVGAGPATTIIRGTASTRAVTFSPSMTRPNSSISGFTIEGGTSTDLRYGGGGVLGGTVSNCVIRGNSAYMGGGVAQAYVTHSIISNNTATVSGGGACASWLDTCLVVHNAANVNLAGFDTSAYGGGVPSANDNESGGGGIAFSAANFCTITRNTSTTYAGGGMFVVLDNTYFAGNTATLGGQYRQNGDLFPVYPSYICATSPTFPDADGFVNATEDDSLADPDHGDYTLKATSLCVEGGDADDEARRTATDLAGNPRWRGSAPDIGCYEAAAPAPTLVQGVEAATGLSSIEGGEGVAIWWDATRGAEWYTVHRGTSSNDYAAATLIATVNSPTVEFEDFTAAQGVNYYYWVVAHSTVGHGPVGACVLGNWVSELVITTPYLPDGLTRELYSTNLTATGGMPPYTWTVTTPSWLSVSGSTISGMPRSQGAQTVVVTVSDTSGQQTERRYTLNINRNTAPLGPATPYAGECYEGNYLIENFEQLRLFESVKHNEDGVNGSYFEGCTFTLTADIDCMGSAFVPTNSRMYEFKGVFDGAGHRIYNFTNDVHGCGSLVGVASSGAVVKNVTLEGYIRLSTLWDYWGTTALSTDWGAGAIAEYAEGSADGVPGLTIENCHFVGTIINAQSTANPNDNPYAGGLVGWVDNETLAWTNAPAGTVNVVISNSTVNAETISAYQWAGGLVGIGWGVKVDGCSVTGTVSTAKSLGGLAGEVRKSWFTDCSFSGTVVTPSSISRSPMSGGGGLVGVAADVEFRNCSAMGLVNWEYSVAHNNFVDRSFYLRTDSDYNYTASGGAAGLTYGTTAFYDCSFEGSIQSTNGFFGGFVGWTAGAETFSNCTTRAVYAPGGMYFAYGTGGFAGNVASAGARFIDCSAEPLEGSKRILGGFFADQTPVEYWPIVSDGVGSNSFVRCSVRGFRNVDAGFAPMAWNCTFKGCTVRDVTSKGAGFVGSAGDPPGDGYLYAQNSLYEDCSVADTKAVVGFVTTANSGGKNGSTNVFRRCRASCVLESSTGFASTLSKGTIAEDCIGHGISTVGSDSYGFASSIDVGAAVRRCVGAVLPRAQGNRGAGFASSIAYNTPVEDCYSVYAPPIADTSARMGGFVSSASVGYNSTGPAVTRCFALAAPADGSDSGNSGSFCGYVYNADYANFVDCWRPAESNVRDVGNGNNGGDDAGVGALTKAQFASATAATMPNYDFQHVWHAPRGVASSPYLDASVDANTNFWFLATVIGGEGRILVNGAEPAEAYPAGTVLTVEAVPNSPGLPFAGWVGEGFADPMSPRTTYTVKNVSAITASFCTPIYTVADWTNVLSCASVSAPSGNYALMNDLDFTGLFESNGWQNVRVGSFTGKFFGQGHTISNLCTTRGDFSSTVALFSKVSAGAEIRDLTVISSNVPSDENPQNTLSLAGLAVEVGSGVTISNCHAVVDWQGVYPAIYDNYGYGSCLYYGLARTVSGTDIHIVDCTVRGRLAGGTQACGFVGSATLNGSEIARCAVLAEVSTLTNRTDGLACGFASSISLSGGSTIRECFSAGVVDAAANAAGFAYEISVRDGESQVRDCYSTAEVLAGASQNPAGFACRISDNNDNGGVLPLANCWFGGTVRCRGKASDYYKPYGFAYYLTGDVSFENCAWIEVPGVNEAGTAGVTALPQAASRQAASWPGYDFANTWSLIEGSTTPYFAWSLTTNGSFRVIAAEEPGTTIVCGDAAPGSSAVISASADNPGWFFDSWKGVVDFADAGANPTTFLADNHRAVRCAWVKAITTRAELAAIASDPAGIYVLGCDIDLAGAPWTPLCQGEYTPFTGTLYGNGHTISNLVVDTDGYDYAGLFGRLGKGATVTGVKLVNPVVSGGGHTGAFAGCVNAGANVSQCAVIGGRVTATRDYSGVFAGYVDGGSVSECFAVGSVTSTYGYVGGFAGYMDGATLSDCYAVAAAKGGSYVGSFAGQIYGSGTSLARCYAAGTASGSSDAGGFAGNLSSSPVLTDCFAQNPAAATAGVTALDAAEMRTRANFAAFHAAGKWSQTDGRTQPYFAWGLVDGKFIISGDAATVNGLGAYAPGATVPIEAVPTGSLFLGWIGSADYADPTAAATTVLLDNYRTVTVEFGGLITSFDQLANVTNDLTGSFGLGADIDLSGAAWTAIGNNSTPFKGSLYGRGYKITGLRYDNSSGTYAGLFGAVKDATLDGIHLEGVSINGRQYTGALVGDVQGATTIRNCSAEGVVSNNYGYAGLLVGRVYGAGTSFANCAATGAVVAASQDTGGLVGGVYNYAASFTDCDAAVAVSGTSGNNKGGFVGSVSDSNASATFVRCTASGDLTATNSSANVGGFIGYANRLVSFEDCSATGDVSAKGSGTGGFAGKTDGAGSTFTDCTAAGVVRSASSQTGGFIGYANASNVFERCVAEGAVSGTTQTGGFVGQANGERSQYLSCVARGSVAGTGGYYGYCGGFVGQSGSSGIRFVECAAFGGVSSTATSGGYSGGFVGYVSNSNDFWRCMSAGPVTGKSYVGGFGGSFYSGNTVVRECFALGDATANNAGDACAGGFAGEFYAKTLISDCYCLGTVKGQQKVGGFAGRNYNSATKIERCYAAGVVDCAGAYAGAFIGYNQYVPTFTNCAVLFDGIHAIGSSAAGSSTENTAIPEYDEAGMKSTANFATWLLVDGLDGSVWSQSDGITQPYLAWSAPNGKLSVYASVGGSARGEIEGAGEYAPGTTATVTAIPDGGFFVAWTGSTPYESRTNQTTTISLDNHRVAAVVFGKYIATADELDAVRNDLAGVYGLGRDIDLSGRDWTPIGNSSTKFSGQFYGLGHEITGLVCTNGYTTSSSNYRGLFGATSGATLDGVAVKDCDVAGYQYVGGLVGRIYDGTSITGCSASGRVYASSGYAGGLVGACDDGTVSVRNSSAAVETTGGSNVGGFIGRVNGSGYSVFSGCRADGFASGTGSVGGFVGYVSAPALFSGCAARGDVHSTGNDMGGFVGYFSNASATNSACWSSGAVWGTGDRCGAFMGNWSSSRGTTVGCAASVRANGARQFCGSNAALTGDALTDDEIAQRSAGWPKIKPRWKSAKRITTAEELFAVTNDLAGIYVLANDIDLEGVAILPIGNSSKGFTGEFYGQNHCISNYVVNATAQCAGFFGNIAGGRVEGVQAFGTVGSSGSYVGGFAGKIGSRSLVKGCSFVGAVSGTSTQVGGFAGYMSDSPSIAECCAVGTVSKTSGTGSGYVGGFVGQQSNGGFIADSYARVAVDAGAAGYAGGFAGGTTGAKIVRAYCSGGVSSTAPNNYVGAFGGNMTAGVVTNAYYDADATTQLAAGKYNAASIDYVGITPVAGADMKKQSSFPAFDFDATWNIDEGETMPYLLAFLVQRNAFMTWLEDELNLPSDTDPLTMVNGVPLLARYVYGILPLTGQTDADGHPLVDFGIDADGTPWFALASRKNEDEYGMQFSVLWSPNLADDWKIDPGDVWPLEIRFDLDGDGNDATCHPPVDPDDEPQMFFKYKIVIDD